MGDKPGHRFRGNQWSRASSGGGSAGVSLRKPHDASTGMRNPDGTLKDDRSGTPPEPGEEFVVYRLGREGTTELRGNAGNAEGVADHLTRNPEGNTIHAFRVKVEDEFGDYQMIRGGEGVQGQGAKVGRLVQFDQGNGRAGVIYSFGKDTKYKARKIGSVTLKQAERKLRAKGLWDHVTGGGQKIGAGGTLSIADGIREVFRG